MEKKRPSCRMPEVETEAQELEVLICEEGLCRKCAFCGHWETEDAPRYSKVGMDQDDPLYWCGAGHCIQKNRLSVLAKMRKLLTRSTEPPWNEYFGSW